MNIIKINEIAYLLPDDAATRRSVMNHIDMVRQELKQFVKLKDLNGNWQKLSSFEITTAFKNGRINVDKYDNK